MASKDCEFADVGDEVYIESDVSPSFSSNYFHLRQLSLMIQKRYSTLHRAHPIFTTLTALIWVFFLPPDGKSIIISKTT